MLPLVCRTMTSIPDEYFKGKPQDGLPSHTKTPIGRRRDTPVLEPTGGVLASRNLPQQDAAEAIMWRTKLHLGVVRSRILLEVWDAGSHSENIKSGWRSLHHADALTFNCQVPGTVWQIWMATRKLIRRWGRRRRR
jgi:hypothetical protein